MFVPAFIIIPTHLHFILPSPLTQVDHTALANEDKDDGENPLGALEKGVLQLHRITVQKKVGTEARPYIFSLVSRDDPKDHLDVGAETEEELMDWVTAIDQSIKELADKYVVTRGYLQERSKASGRVSPFPSEITVPRSFSSSVSPFFAKRHRKQNAEQKKLKISRNLSALVFYSQSVSFRSFEESQTVAYYKMSSFVEKKAFNLVRMSDDSQAVQFNAYNRRQFSRVYPNGKRVASDNYDPQPLWNVGVQLAALNYQTNDRSMWLNHGKFTQNGKCGYVLKPMAMLKGEGFDPYNHTTYQVDPLTLKIKVRGRKKKEKSLAAK